jgi:hypothetical protein
VNIAVGPSNVYWTDAGSGGFIYSTPLTGGGSGVAGAFGGDCGVMGLTIDATTIYGITRTGSCSSLTTGAIKSVPMAGGSVTTVAASAGGGYPTQSWHCMAVDSTNLYFTNFDIEYVFKVPKAGGSVTNLTPSPQTDPGVPMAIVVSGSNLFWNTQTGGVMQMPTSGGGITSLPTGTTGSSIAVDGSYVYYISGGALKRLPLTGSTPVTLVASGAVGPLVIDTNNVYYLGSSTVMMVAKTGGSTTTVASGQSSMKDIGVDGTSVYWTAGNSILKRAR